MGRPLQTFGKTANVVGFRFQLLAHTSCQIELLWEATNVLSNVSGNFGICASTTTKSLMVDGLSTPQILRACIQPFLPLSSLVLLLHQVPCGPRYASVAGSGGG